MPGLTTRYRVPCALLLSAAAHAGLAAWLLARPGGASTAPRPVAASPLAVRLVPAGGAKPLPAATAPVAAPLARAARQATPEPPPLAPPAPPSPILPSIPAQAGIRYFQSNELTEEPRVISGLVADWLLIVPGAPTAELTLRLGLDDQGNVVWAAIEDSHLSEEEQRIVRAALATLKFAPARIGRIAVHSDITLPVKVDSVLRY